MWHERVPSHSTDPILLLGLQLFDALQEALFGAIKVIGQASDGDFVRLLLRSRHLNINLEADSEVVRLKLNKNLVHLLCRRKDLHTPRIHPSSYEFHFLSVQ